MTEASLKRLNILAKGNLDLRDSLHSLWIGGACRWNGINSLLREQGSDVSIRVRHETATGTQAMLEATGEVPALLAGRALPIEPHQAAVQFGRTVFTAPADAVILSIQPDLQIAPGRHRAEGFLFYPHNVQGWPQADRAWLRAGFEPGELIDADAAMTHLETLIARLREGRDVPILIYNVSSLVPGETVHCHAGMEDIFSTRIKRFNLALVELSQRTGISIVDVDRIVARHGQQAMKLDTTHLTEQGCRAVAEEVLRILGDCGCLGEADAGR